MRVRRKPSLCRHYGVIMNRRSPVVQFVSFVLVLVLINLVLWAVGSSMRISIIGSIVLSVVVGGVMGAMNRPR